MAGDEHRSIEEHLHVLLGDDVVEIEAQWESVRMILRAAYAVDFPPAVSGGEHEPSDTDRIEMLQSLIVGMDFQWGDPPTSVMVFTLPSGIRNNGDVRKWLDDCRAAARPSPACRL